MTNSTVLYVPGLDGTGRLLYRQTALTDQFNVVCQSYPQDRSVTYVELANESARLMTEATGGEPGVVLAESFGGAVALTLALNNPELISRMILVNTFARFPTRYVIRIVALLSWMMPNRTAHPATRGIRSWFFMAKEVPKEVRNQWWEQTGGVPMSAMGNRLRMLAKVDLRKRLGEIEIPTLVLAAPNDKIVPPGAGREIARLLPCAHLIQPPAGHAAMVHPDIDIAQLLEDPSYWDREPASTTE